MARSKGIIRVIKALRKGRRTKGTFAGRVATLGAGSALLTGGLGYIDSLIDQKINDFAQSQQPEYSMADLGFVPKEQSTSSEISTIDLSDIINAVSVVPEDIIPELGSTEGEYSRHLNLIIKRVAKLESAILTQANLIAKLEDAIGNYNDNARKENLRKRRQEKEDDTERTFARNAARAVIDKTKDIGSAIGGMLKPFLLPIAALTLASAASAMDDEQGSEEEPLLSDENLDAIGEAFNFMETTAVSTVIAGGGLAKAVSTLGGALKTSGIGTTIGALGSGAKGAISSVTTPVINAIGKFTNAAKANVFINAITHAGTFLGGIAKKAGDIVNSVKSFVNNLPSAISNIIKKAGKTIVKWFLIWESLQFMWRSAQLYAIGGISEEKFHKDNKEQINSIIKVMGAPWVLMKIGFLAGVPFSPVGAALGTVIGFIVGLIWGDDIYDVIGMNSLVDMLYDWAVLGKDISAEASQMWNKITNYFTDELPKIIKEAIIDFGSNLKNSVTSFAVDAKDAAVNSISNFYNNSDAKIIADSISSVFSDEETPVSTTNISTSSNTQDDPDESNQTLKNYSHSDGKFYADGKEISSEEFANGQAEHRKRYKKDLIIAGIVVEKDGVPMPLKEEERETIKEYIKYNSWHTVKDGRKSKGTYWIKDYDLSKNPNTTSKPSVDVLLNDIVPVTKEKKDVVVVPLVMPQSRARDDLASYNAGNSRASMVESASPSFSTRDNYLDLNLTT